MRIAWPKKTAAPVIHLQPDPPNREDPQQPNGQAVPEEARANDDDVAPDDNAPANLEHEEREPNDPIPDDVDAQENNPIQLEGRQEEMVNAPTQPFENLPPLGRGRAKRSVKQTEFFGVPFPHSIKKV